MSVTGLSVKNILLEKAKCEDKIIIYEEHGNGYNISYSYSYVYYLDFSDVDTFCNSFYEICQNICGYANMPYEFQCFEDCNFSVDIDYQSIIVNNFPVEHMDECENKITQFFANKRKKEC